MRRQNLAAIYIPCNPVKLAPMRALTTLLANLQCANTDVVAGWCESGSVFVADVRQDCLSVIG